MKHFTKLLTLGAALVASVSVASATPINGTVNLTGTGAYNASGIQFTSESVAGTSTGDLSFLTSAAVVGGLNPIVYANLTPGTLLFSATQNGETFSFFSGTFTSQGTKGIIFDDFGTVTLTGTGAGMFTTTLGEFSVSTTGAGNTINITFAGSALGTGVNATTPEPSSLIMLGTGLVSAAGMLVRRRRIV